MEIKINAKARIKEKLITGIITQIGCDKCILESDGKFYECELNELTDTTFVWCYKKFVKLNQFRDKLEEKVYGFFEDKKGLSSFIIAGSVITLTVVIYLLNM